MVSRKGKGKGKGIETRGRHAKEAKDKRDYIPRIGLDHALGHPSGGKMYDIALHMPLHKGKPNLSLAHNVACWKLNAEHEEFKQDCYREAIKLINDALDSGVNVRADLRVKVDAPAIRVQERYPEFTVEAAISLITSYYRTRARSDDLHKIEDLEAEIKRYFG